MTILFVKAFIFALIVIVIILSVGLWYNWRIEKSLKKDLQTADNGLSLLADNITAAINQYKAGPWYLVVYTHDSPVPTWISNNNIRSVHPDAEHSKLIVKQFNGEDMVIEKVEEYGLIAANEIDGYEM